jgi:subtilisin-like proprotein convertase family protein
MRIPLRLSLGLLAVAALALAGIMFLRDDAAPATASLGDISHVMWGDPDCDNTIDASDVLTLEQSLLGITQSRNSCANDLHVGTAIQNSNPDVLRYSGFWGDFDCNRSLNAFDIIGVLKKAANLPLDQRLGCIDYGDYVDVSEIIVGQIATPPDLPFLGIDADPSGNSANSLGTIDHCRSVDLGDTFTVDVLVKGVPPYQPYAGGLGGFDIVFAFYPGRLGVMSIDDHQMLAVGTSNILSYTNTGHNATGLTVARAYDQSNNPEQGDGVLFRLTMKAVGSGPAGMYLDSFYSIDPQPGVVDNQNYIYPITTVGDALIMIDSPCPNESPTPTPSPSPSPSPSPTPPPPNLNQCVNAGQTQEIPNGDTNGITSTLSFLPPINQDSDAINNMSMCLNISHEYVGDLYVTLTHNNETMVIVDRLGNAQSLCSGNGHGLYVYLTDTPNPQQGTEDACGNNADVIGTFYANQYFADTDFNGVFAGDLYHGDWTLTVVDDPNSPSDVPAGQLLGWSLFFNQ